jgi:hypothetical protein
VSKGLKIIWQRMGDMILGAWADDDDTSWQKEMKKGLWRA